MHKEDKIQKLEQNGKPILDGGITFCEMYPDKNREYLSSGAGILIYHQNEGKIELLFQKRSQKMMTDPGKGDIHGGYVNYGETPLETVIRETKEELGLSLNPEKIKLAFMLRQPHEVCYYYIYDFTDEKQKITFEDGEAKAIKWIDLKTFKTTPEIINLKEPLISNKQFLSLAAAYLENYGNLDK